MALLEVNDLKMHYDTRQGVVKAIDGLTFSLPVQGTLGIAGESGCGKSSLGLSILRLLPPNARFVSGSIRFDGQELLEMPEPELRTQIRWKRISMVFQGAMNALNPVLKVGDQISEAIIHTEGAPPKEAHDRTIELLEMVGISAKRAREYPHEFSGGMKQRAVIAMALACRPDLIIADEPTTALDTLVRAQVMQTLIDLRTRFSLAMILISHDLPIIAKTCDQVMIMYAGKIMETGDTVSVFTKPLHPYTQGLITAVPHIRAEQTTIKAIPGHPPDLLNPPSGCVFHPRCPLADDECRKTVPTLRSFGKQMVACHQLTPKTAAEVV
ncbi:MAG: ABC transporter ATP-binding protein [Limnochordia bacterium]|nr:ABC transporter ATP-binding protein [Limnochordia bacterium]